MIPPQEMARMGSLTIETIHLLLGFRPREVQSSRAFNVEIQNIQELMKE